jgi:ribosomal protein S6--L-glutamate ligase
MKICLLAEPNHSPVLASVVDALEERHTVTVGRVQSLGAAAHAAPGEFADLYLLKSRSAEAQAFARRAQHHGAVVVNSPDATASALDRWTMARQLDLHGVPSPRTWSCATLETMVAEAMDGSMPWPLVVKSRTSRRGDLVRLVRSEDELRSLLAEWGQEPVIAQEYIDNDGFDIKAWVIGGHLSAARRAAALEACDKSKDVAIDAADLPAAWSDAAFAAGSALGLDLFGADLVVRDGRPWVIDVNAFPGFQGARNPVDSMVSYLESLSTARTALS